jgi:hypothetical protein
METLRRSLTLALIMFFSAASLAQGDSCKLRISLLTCGPGTELYSLFGHSAFRVTDSSRGMDIVFNYGTMDFDDPAFYMKFTKGEMIYYLSVSTFNDFMYEYKVTKRDVLEQALGLSCAEKEKLFAALRENAREENKYYSYEFLFNNCSSKLRDMLKLSTGNRVRFGNILPPEPPSFRNMIHEYLNKGKQYWSKFGIDILLGANLDKKVTNEQSMFLPDYLMKGFDSTWISPAPASAGDSIGKNTPSERNAVVQKRELFLAGLPPVPEPFFTPLLAFIALFLVVLALSFSRSPLLQKTLQVADFVLFLLSGLLGILLLFLWIGRQDTVCRNNLNLLWALPTHSFIAFFLRKKTPWVRFYLIVTAAIGALLLLTWIWLPQQLNPALIPLVILLIVRSILIVNQYSKHGKKAEL